MLPRGLFFAANGASMRAGTPAQERGMAYAAPQSCLPVPDPLALSHRRRITLTIPARGIG